MIADTTDRSVPTVGRLPGPLVVLVGLGVLLAALAGLGVQSVRADRTVSVQRDARTVHDTALDNAFYRCIDVQTRSLVSPGEPIVFTGSLGDIVTLIKGVGSWVTIANPFSSAVVQLSLRDDVRGPGACLGSVVIATSRTPYGGRMVRIGSGASVSGAGPPPAPPL